MIAGDATSRGEKGSGGGEKKGGIREKLKRARNKGKAKERDIKADPILGFRAKGGG